MSKAASAGHTSDTFKSGRKGFEPSGVYVSPMEGRIEGWLEKRGEINTAWKKRWFVGGPEGTVSYMKSQQDKKSKGIIELAGLQVCWDLPDAGTRTVPGGPRLPRP